MLPSFTTAERHLPSQWNAVHLLTVPWITISNKQPRDDKGNQAIIVASLFNSSHILSVSFLAFLINFSVNTLIV